MFISEGGCLISDIFEVSDLLKLKGLLLTVDIENAFDSVNFDFLLKVLENDGFSQDLRLVTVENRSLARI